MSKEKPLRYGGMRRFRLDRHEDAAGVSGIGCIAQGVVFSDGTVALRWMTEHRSTVLYDSIGTVERIHGHDGKTTIRWEDPICFCCGTTLLLSERAHVLYCFDCGAGQGDEAYNETRPDPSLGSWSPALTIHPDGVVEAHDKPRDSR